MLSLCNHLNIIKCHNYYETPEKIYLFLEYFDGENLLDILLKEKKLPTQIVLDILQQLLKTICYLQEVHNIVHRDLKLENILVKFLDGNKLQVKLIDFGCARQYKTGEILKNFCGSLFYIAPEVFFNHYNEKCDLWSLGVVAFALLTGKFPFDDKDDEKVQEKICYKKVKFNKKEKKAIYKPIRKLIKGMLKKDCSKRIDAHSALYHAKAMLQQ